MSSAKTITTTTTPTATPTATPRSGTETVLETTGEVGKIYGYIGVCSSVVITICLCICGIYMVATPDELKNYIKINATIVDATCDVTTQQSNNRGTTTTTNTYNCNLACVYTVNNQTYTTPLTISSQTRYMKDSKIDILYDPNDPSKIVQVPSISKNNLGWILVVCGLVLLLITVGYYFLTKKSSAFNKLQGISGIASVIRF
jgi:hypothetical protein